MSSSVAEAAAKERLHSSGEDYLKAIFILEAQHGSVRSVEVAEYMNVSKASVNHAVRHTRNQAHYFEQSGCQLIQGAPFTQTHRAKITQKYCHTYGRSH